MTITRSEIDSKFELSDSAYSIDNKIGEGSYGTVYLGLFSSKNKVAVKVVRQDKDNTGEQECRIMGLLNNPATANENSKYIVKFFGYRLLTYSTYHLVLEYMNSDTLENWIYNFSPKGDAKWKEGYSIINHVINGICYLHYLNIIHRDLKPANILLDRDDSTKKVTAKIADFGLAYQLVDQNSESSKVVQERKGSLLYMAPEVIARTSSNSKSSDIFSFGMTLWETEAKMEPYPGIKNEPQLVRHIKQKGCEQPISDNCPPKIARLITLCLATDPKTRPTAEKIAEDLKSDISVKSTL